MWKSLFVAHHEEPPAEGWYRDPCGVHEARWLSNGVPTDLVSDGGHQTNDPPPNRPMPVELERIIEPEAHNGDDLKRVGEAKPREGMSPKEQSQRVWDVIGGAANHS
jgi:hypothetical protein